MGRPADATCWPARRTMADIQRQGAESTAAFDEFRAEAQRRSTSSRPVRRACPSSPPGPRELRPNVGLPGQPDGPGLPGDPAEPGGRRLLRRLGTGVQSLGQSSAANPLTPLAPAMAQQVTSGVVRQVADSIGRSDEQVVGGIADAATDLRTQAYRPPPSRSSSAYGLQGAVTVPLPLSFLGGGSFPARLGLGAASRVGAGVGMAAGEALEPNCPRGASVRAAGWRPTGGVGLPLLANAEAGVARTARGVARAIAEGGPEPGVIRGRAGPAASSTSGPTRTW